jgi:hypothetical protein
MIHSGQHGSFYWLVAQFSPGPLTRLTVRFHTALRLCITAFDSGPLLPSPEEEAAGWTVRGEVMVSPPLAEGLYIPCGEYDEWYLLEEPPPADWTPEVFVNDSAFTLVPVEELRKLDDPTWCRYGNDWLIPLQESFWEQMERVKAVSYIAMGDHDIIVSQRREFIERVRAAADPQEGRASAGLE